MYSCKYVLLPLWPRCPWKRDFNIHKSFSWLNKGLMNWDSANSVFILPPFQGRFHELKRLFPDWYFRYGTDGQGVLTNIQNTLLSVNRTHVVHKKKMCFVGEWSRRVKKNVCGKLTAIFILTSKHENRSSDASVNCNCALICICEWSDVTQRDDEPGWGGTRPTVFRGEKGKKMSSFRSWRLDKKRLSVELQTTGWGKLFHQPEQKKENSGKERHLERAQSGEVEHTS